VVAMGRAPIPLTGLAVSSIGLPLAATITSTLPYDRMRQCLWTPQSAGHDAAVSPSEQVVSPQIAAPKFRYAFSNPAASMTALASVGNGWDLYAQFSTESLSLTEHRTLEPLEASLSAQGHTKWS
jgi:hypothetical protein